MAGTTSGSFYADTSTNAYRFILYWTITNQGISGSTAYSDVTFTFKGRRLNTSYNSYNGNSGYSFSVDGASNASGSLNFDSRNWANDGTEYTLWSSPVSVRVNHGSTGSKTLPLSFTLTTGTSGAGTVTVSGSAVLQDIAMAGTLSLGSSTLTISNSTGPTQTFTIGQYQSSYNYKVEWKIGSTLVATTTIPANNTTTRSQVLGASTWGPKMTNTSSTTVTAILYTYSGSTQIGSTSSATFTLKYTIAPTLSSASASMSTTCRSYTQGLRSYYYKGQSAVVITANSFSGNNGSSLSSYTFYMNNSAVSTQTATSWTSGTLNTVGTITFKVRATDTRGNYVEKSTSITVVDYAVPQITARNAYRVSSGSTADSSGTKIYYTATAAATGSGNSIKTLSVATSPAATSSTASVSNSTSMSGTLDGAFSITSQYTVTFTATDAMGYSSTATVPVPTAKRIINVNQAKNGIGFGMFAQAGLATFAMPIKSTGTITSGNDAVVGVGTSSPTLRFECPVGTRWGDIAIRTTATSGIQRPTDMVLRTWSYNSSTGARTGYYDQYKLPDVTPDKTFHSGYAIWTTKNCVAVAPTSYTVTSGYFVLSNSAITANSVIIAQPMYSSSAGASKYIFTPQPQSGSANVYVRDGSGALPTNGTTVQVAFLIINI